MSSSRTPRCVRVSAVRALSAAAAGRSRRSAGAVLHRRPRLHQGRRAGRRADQRPRDRRHRRAGEGEPDARASAAATSPRSATPRASRRPRARPSSTSTGKSVIPGLVMVHEHLYYPTGPGVYGQLGESFIRLYLAGGVTTMRTGGNVNGFMDLKLKQLIEAGPAAGPGDRRDRAVPERPEHVPADARHEGRRRGAQARGLLGRHGRDVVQGLHADHARAARRGDRGGAQARAEGHRPSLLGDLRGSRRSRHRQPRARVPRRDRLRRRQAAGRVSRPGRRPADDRGARRERRAVQGAGEEARRQEGRADLDAHRVRDVHAGPADAAGARRAAAAAEAAVRAELPAHGAEPDSRSTRRCFRRRWRSSARSRAPAAC